LGRPRQDPTYVEKLKSDAESFINVNGRHKVDFNKHKSSQAMKTLLKADDQAKQKSGRVKSGSEITSKIHFEAKREGIESTAGILNKGVPRTAKNR
jgi:hypothetical protein